MRFTKISIAALGLVLVAGQVALAEETSSTYKAVSGPGGAKVSKTNTSMHANADGSVSADRSHESHTMSAAGDSHHTSNSSTTLNPDGSTSSVKSSATSTNP